jgi:hypothetical protein
MPVVAVSVHIDRYRVAHPARRAPHDRRIDRWPRSDPRPRIACEQPFR